MKILLTLSIIANILLFYTVYPFIKEEAKKQMKMNKQKKYRYFMGIDRSYKTKTKNENVN